MKKENSAYIFFIPVTMLSWGTIMLIFGIVMILLGESHSSVPMSSNIAFVLIGIIAILASSIWLKKLFVKK